MCAILSCFYFSFEIVSLKNSNAAQPHYLLVGLFISCIAYVKLTFILCMLQVVARDDDQGSNSKLSYALLGGNEDNAFILSVNGDLRVTQSLDRETKEHFVLMVTATDSGKTITTVYL
jgi:hypothetical protein